MIINSFRSFNPVLCTWHLRFAPSAQELAQILHFANSAKDKPWNGIWIQPRFRMLKGPQPDSFLAVTFTFESIIIVTVTHCAEASKSKGRSKLLTRCLHELSSNHRLTVMQCPLEFAKLHKCRGSKSIKGASATPFWEAGPVHEAWEVQKLRRLDLFSLPSRTTVLEIWNDPRSIFPIILWGFVGAPWAFNFPASKRVVAPSHSSKESESSRPSLSRV